MIQGPHHPQPPREAMSPGPAGTFWRPRFTLARGMTIVALSACVFWSAREFAHRNFIASFVVSEGIWVYFLIRLIRGRSKDGRIF